MHCVNIDALLICWQCTPADTERNQIKFDGVLGQRSRLAGKMSFSVHTQAYNSTQTGGLAGALLTSNHQRTQRWTCRAVTMHLYRVCFLPSCLSLFHFLFLSHLPRRKVALQIYRVGQKKVSQKLMTITLSNLNGFSKFFQHLKENYRKLSTKPMLIKSYID